MTYNFHEPIVRRGTNCVKWDEATNDKILPFWVADMDFRVAQPIIDALRRRMEHGVFGYTHVPDAYYRAVVDWFGRRHQWTIEKEWILYTSGVIPAIAAILKAVTLPGEKVLMQTPVYNCFYSCIRNCGCQVASNPLINDNGTYRIDFEDLERKAADPLTRVLILCNPHNPAGRVWTREELQRIGDICLKHQVFVIADEIHCELVMPGHTYTPYASLGEAYQRHSATCNSPSKSFNIAGLQIANIVVEDQPIRTHIDRAININETCDVNPFGVEALIAAYNEGEEWLTQLNAYLWKNYEYMRRFCEANLPQFPISRLEGTYLVWMDCRTLSASSEALEQSLMDEAGIWLNAGAMYGPEGEGFMRWNIACPQAQLAEGLNRFLHYVTQKMNS